jgi:phage gp37-like protein
MKISELIEKLEKIKEQIGDAPVEVRNESGDWDYACVVDIVNANRAIYPQKWKVFIES